MTSTTATGPVDIVGAAVRSDGGLTMIRTLRPEDGDGLRQLVASASVRSIRNRFFTAGTAAASRYVDMLLAELAARSHRPDRVSLVAVIGDRIVGLATLDPVAVGVAEVALLVEDAQQGEGIGTLLLEALVTAARGTGIARLVADVLMDNVGMIAVFRSLGLPMRTEVEDGVMQVVIPLAPADDYARAVTVREHRAEQASLQALLAPQSIAVVGGSTREHSIGHAVLENLVTAGYCGALYVVNPRSVAVLGIPAVASCDLLPEPPDLAVVAVPATAVPEVVAACGRRGAKVVLLLTSGFGELGEHGFRVQDEVLAIARHHGMRLVGPNCLGVVNTDPGVRLNATFAPMPMDGGGLALVSQSGAVGVALAAAGARRGLGLAQFVSVGNKADVSGNDLLLAWQDDARVSVIAMYLESFGNPRRFARIARAVARDKPILALKSGRGAAGQRAGLSHTAAAAAVDPVVTGLLAQTGVQRVDTMEQLLDAARVIDAQPRPAGDRVAIIGNSGGPGILAADAAEAAGLCVVDLSAATRARLCESAPALASAANPVDLGAAVPPGQVAAAIKVLVDAPEVDALVTVFTETLTAAPQDIRAAVLASARSGTKPVVAVEVGAPPCTVPIDATSWRLPVFAFPENALGALAVAVRCAEARTRGWDAPVEPSGIDLGHAAEVVAGAIRAGRDWLDPDECAAVLAAVGVPACAHRVVRGASAAVDAAHALGYPVAVKLTHGVHKSELGGVRLHLRDADDVRAAVAALAANGAEPEVLVQPMRTDGVELIVGAVQDPKFGPVIMLGAGGVFTELLGVRTLRLAPLGRSDVQAMVDAPELRRLLDGFRGRPPVSRTALADVVHRVATLADRLPQIAELDLNPVICAGEDLVAVDAKIRVAAAAPAPDPMSRMLNG
jgi:acyl-CoA synthetase (NDP forming)/GNAT superfamily N-acetyltransferase